jgi:hypothetical protein
MSRSGGASDDWVSASEIGAYAYCARAYWLERIHAIDQAQIDGSRFDAGIAHHGAHGRRVTLQRWLLRLAVLLLAAAIVVVWIESRA